MKGRVQSHFSRILLVLHWEEEMAYSSDDFTFQLPSVIRGHHPYESVWTPSIGETLALEVDTENMLMLWACATATIEMRQGQTESSHRVRLYAKCT